MTTCKVTNCNNTNLIYSGIDAFMFGGIPTEAYCYSCATAYHDITNAVAAMYEEAK